MSEAVALKKTNQSGFAKRVKKVKEKVNRGVIKVREGIAPEIPARAYGLIYIGHIPHGFYEEEMREYFKQFGLVTNARVCRSKKTGKSKGYGFVQFRYPEVAQIAAQTMDNYLMFNRRIVCTYIPPEKQRRTLFGKVVWSTKNYPLKEARKLHIKKRNGNQSEEKFNVNRKKALSKIKEKMDKLKELGVNHVFRPTDVPYDMLHLIEENPKEISENTSKGDKIKTIAKEVTSRSLKTIKKKKDQVKKSTLPKISFMQSDRIKRLASVEILKENLVTKVNKLKKLR